MGPLLEVKGISFSYQRTSIIRDLSFSLEKGQIACILGPSGCGKTTVLRAIAGFERLQEGQILLQGSIVSRRGWTLKPEKRQVGMVFQDFALFPHLNVLQNIAFGLHRLDEKEKTQRVYELLETMDLTTLAKVYPHELSGGQQQRVALARALAPRPAVLLLDEPFSSLDVDLRERLSVEVRDILKRYHVTTVLVTHDQHEAFAIADEIGVMNDGAIQQWASAYDLYHKPANRFVADFVGQGVLLPGTVLNSRQLEIELGIISGDIPPLCTKGSRVDVLFRPDDIIHDDASDTLAQVISKAFRGAEILYTLRLSGGGKVLALVPSHHNHAIGEKIGIRLAIDHVVAFPRT